MHKDQQLIIGLFISFLWCAILRGQTADVVINELLASNLTESRDPDFAAFCDWIELHNTTIGDINLGGFFLTDNLDEPFKWEIPFDTLIPAKGFLLFWADGRDIGNHTNFKLSKTGEQLGLYSSDGKLVDALTFGAQMDDMSFGRIPEDPNRWGILAPPTPGTLNDSIGQVAVTPAPLFSITGGFYQGGQTLQFLNSESIEIYFTLDGTSPNTNDLRYWEPIPLNSTRAIRAIGYLPGHAPSEVVTHTYFIDEAVHLPFISIVTAPDYFFSDERGIYVTGTNGRGGYCDNAIRNLKQDWERPVNVELYEMDGECGFNQGAGVKIFGGCSRHRFPQKSLALFARRVYGKGSFEHQIFPEKDIDRFESFILRSSADDQVLTLFRDALSQTVLVEHMDVDYQAYRPAVLFLNGQYWGIHNIREKINEYYVAGNFFINAREVNLLERNGVAVAGSNAGYTSMVTYASNNNMNDPERYAFVEEQVDISQYIDYQIGHIYLAERDWPGNNIKFWRANSGPLAKWRWINYDMDQCFSPGWIHENMIFKTTTQSGPGWPNPEWSTRLFRSLLRNEDFRNEFIQRYAYHMNTTFQPERLLRIIDQFQTNLAPEIPRHIERWGGQRDEDALETWQRPTFNSVGQWERNIDQMRRFAVERPTATIGHVLDHFDLSGTSQLSLNLDVPDSGVLQVNGKRFPNGFLGDYFNDIPIVLSATPLLGYSFSHWVSQYTTVSSETIFPAGSIWSYSDRGLDLGTRWRQVSYDDRTWPSGPAQLGYGDRDEATLVSYGGDASDKYPTTYFRKSFELTDGIGFQTLRLSLLVDDGAVVYMNGQEVLRTNMPAGPIYYTTLAPLATGNENSFTEFPISPDYLRPGTNILAVEVHQTENSSDISFDCALYGQTVATERSERHETPDLSITLTGDAQLTAFFNKSTIPISDPIVITEINFNSAPETDCGDWVELYNATENAIDLTGWQFRDSGETAYTFPRGTMVWPRAYLVLCRNRIKFRTVFPYVKNLLGPFDFGLSREGESIYILDNDNNIIDTVDYRAVTPWPETAQGTGYTLELVDTVSDNNLGKNWQSLNLLGTPGAPYK